MNDSADRGERLIAATLASGLLANSSKKTTSRAQEHLLKPRWRSISSVWMHSASRGRSARHGKDGLVGYLVGAPAAEDQ